MFQKYLFYLLFLFLPISLFSQKLGFNHLLKESPEVKMPFTVENNAQNLRFLINEGVKIKQKTTHYIYFTQTPTWVFKQLNEKNISNFYFEYAPPALLDDSARVMHHVNPVHQGQYPLLEGYTGKDVIIGLVDNGLDHNHPDFIDSDGNKRVIRYWDQSITNPTQSPEPYGYGQIWYADQIQDGSITSNEESLGHGTSVTGICTGNGLADGRNKGMAPDAQIVFVETNFNLPNWTLTVADACDFIFRVADSLNKPAVINLSVGSYLGSHDGTDPAGEFMSQLVEDKPGRIIIAAAGNAGGETPWHAQQTMTVSDTNFIWFENNPNGQLGDGTVFFDLWSDIADAQFYYSFGANQNAPSYQNVASTAYRFAQLNVGTTIYDTLFNTNGDQIATIEIYTDYEADNYHMQGFFSSVDSADYLMRFSTTGLGKYDLWSGEWADLNKIVSSVPPQALFPSIVNYVMPDSAESIISSWICAPNIISVANLRCRLGYIDHNGDQWYHPTDMTHPGMIAPSSSRGPARSGLLKPDISASGDVTLGSAPLYMVGNPAYYDRLGELGWHVRNGGSSMASPVVAGIAALYLERCPKSTFEDFKTDLFSTAFADGYTGSTPNQRYGYGKIDAFALLKSKNNNLKILGDTVICQTPVKLTSSIPLSNYDWSNGSSNSLGVVSQPDTIYLTGREMLQGCKIFSDTVIVTQESLSPNPTATISGDSLISSPASNYQWYKDGTPISGATQQSYTPSDIGYYSVAVQEIGYCKSFSNSIGWLLSITQEEKGEIVIYPNPAKSILNIESKGNKLVSYQLYTLTGKNLLEENSLNNEKYVIDIRHLSSGAYIIKIQTIQGIEVLQFFKQ